MPQEMEHEQMVNLILVQLQPTHYIIQLEGESHILDSQLAMSTTVDEE